jgi:hypothetical protein
MSDYLQFRSWLRTSSPAEKKLASAALVIVLGLVGWALVPTGGTGASSLTAGVVGGAAAPGLRPGVGGSRASSSGATGVAGGSVPTGGATAAGGGPVGGAQVGGGSVGAGPVSGGGSPGTAGPTSSQTGGSSGASSPSCAKLTNTDTGVTPTQIKVADVLLNLAGAIGNSAVGQPSPQIQQQMAQAVVDDINAHGGVACRKLVVTYYAANPIDPTSTQNVCLQIAQAGVFAVIGGFAYPAASNDCLAQQKIPVVANIAPTPAEGKQYYPYLMSTTPDPTQDYANAIFGMQGRGYFTAAQGFQKLAILEDDCTPEINRAVYDDLIKAGVRPNQIVKNDFSCPSSGFASPSDMSQFATQDNLGHVTNVVEVTGGGSFKEYSTAAQGQHYKPKYLVSDYNGFLVTATGGTGPDPNNFDGTVVTTDTRFGENNTPGLSDPATQACIALFARHGLPASYITGSYIGGGNCTIFQLFAAAVSHDQGPTRAGLAPGLGQVGRFAMVFPLQDSIYKTPGATTPVKVTGGDFWWTIQFYASCTCWKVIDPTVHPSFQ